MKWLNGLKGTIRFNEPLSKHASFKIGGICRVWFEPCDTDDLIAGVRQAQQKKIPHFIIGNGTNLLFRNGGFKGIIIKLSAPFFKAIDLHAHVLRVGAGASIKGVIRYLSNKEVSGYEFLTGIPGTIGGALIMNAGMTVNGKQRAIGDIVQRVKALDRRGRVWYLTEHVLRFGYRDSNLSNYILLEAELKLKKGKKRLAKSRVRDLLKLRAKKQDYSRPNAGCVFKNPSSRCSAASLIDHSQCKGMRCGGAMVSKKHANFILNFNSATADDVLQLMRAVKGKVRKRFNIQLQEELHIV